MMFAVAVLDFDSDKVCWHLVPTRSPRVARERAEHLHPPHGLGLATMSLEQLEECARLKRPVGYAGDVTLKQWNLMCATSEREADATLCTLELERARRSIARAHIRTLPDYRELAELGALGPSREVRNPSRHQATIRRLAPCGPREAADLEDIIRYHLFTPSGLGGLTASQWGRVIAQARQLLPDYKRRRAVERDLARRFRRVKRLWRASADARRRERLAKIARLGQCGPRTAARLEDVIRKEILPWKDPRDRWKRLKKDVLRARDILTQQRPTTP